MAKPNKAAKTNAVRILDGENIDYELMEYDVSDGQVDGVSVAQKTDQAVETVYKTLVTKAGEKELFVFLLPVALELDLKKAAKAAGVKKLEMLPLKDLTKETGYIRGGCSAIGMKRKYPTFIDANALALDKIIVSAGRPGVQMKLSPEDLREVSEAIFIDIVKTQ
ncbi:Cys-tRNA(Pro) deacylase [Sporosarcina sp. Marseille-Q4063]|uniref:Cys-tRNA(Pro) deacylase n=1 Tax=Sporosarcina sp. Marseille-Q4063 TaxID=2810514 RepID=UPI001BAFBD3C|nr:Cys-tRNA(Pro) deacylase [Sporosarcina sp. Marseille-Q4063]QUW21091.1 Cys-tRNA(Pro) deacylase [Sporosarcina sp. Marseille-Q4063]